MGRENQKPLNRPGQSNPNTRAWPLARLWGECQSRARFSFKVRAAPTSPPGTSARSCAPTVARAAGKRDASENAQKSQQNPRNMGAKINLLFPLTSRSVWGTMGHKRRDHMCRAASFVVTKDKVFWSKMTDSPFHATLLEKARSSSIASPKKTPNVTSVRQKIALFRGN